MKTYLKKGDNVQVISGKEKGKKGRIVGIDKNKYAVLVEGLNLVSKRTKPNSDNPKGGIIQQEAHIHISNLLLVDGKGKPSKIGIRFDKKTGKKERFFKTTGSVLK